MRGSYFLMSMLMFQNGLLATFIPEILMVLGYILCLFTPVLKHDKASIQQNQPVTQITFSDQKDITTNQIAFHDFQASSESIPEKMEPISLFIHNSGIISFPHSYESTTDGLSYVSFSRPPPSFIL